MKLLPLWLLPCLLVGCTSTITNLTPRQEVRNPTGLYPFSVAWDSSQQSIQQDTLKAYVVVGMDSYPMQRTPIVKNRWETVVPVPVDKDVLVYRYKFDFDYLSIPHRRSDSKLSPSYELKILER